MDTLVAAAIHDAKNSLNALGVWLVEAECERTTLVDGMRAHGEVVPPSVALDHAAAIATTLSGQLVELLVLYRAGEGSLRLAVDDHPMDEFLADVMSELNLSRSAKAAANIVLQTDFSAAAEIGLWAFDAYLVKFVLIDALRNALRHAHQNVRFSVTQERQVNASGVAFTIADDGPGYPDDMLGNIDTVDEQRVMQESGSGLGLSFARLIAAHHVTPEGRLGRVELSNTNGARFVLHLP